MAKSFLGAQLEEIPHLIDRIGPSLQKLAQVNAQVLSRRMGVMAPGPGGGGGGGGLLDASGRPLAPSSGALGRGSSSIEEFLRRLAEQSAADSNRASGGSGKGSSGSGTMLAAPIQATEYEKATAKSLGETVEYLRKLMAAAKWAGIYGPTVLRSPKGERDALIAAYEAYVESTSAGATSTKGALNKDYNTRTGWNPDGSTFQYQRGDDPARPVGGGGGGDPTTGGGGGGSHNPLGPVDLGTGGTVYSTQYSAQVAAAKIPTAGDKLVAETVGGVTKAIDRLAAKLDTGGNLAFRTKGL